MFDNVPPRQDPARQPPRLRLRLLLGLLLSALPLLGCGAGLLAWLRMAEMRERGEMLARGAETLTLAIEGTLAAGLNALETLAGSRVLESRDLVAFREEARRLLAREPAWHTIALQDGARQVMNLRHPAETTPPRGDLRTAAAAPTDRTSAAEMPDGRILLRVPVRSEGAVRGTLVAVLEASALAAPIARIGLPAGWSALLLDGEGRRLAGGATPAAPAMTLAEALAAPGQPQPLNGGGLALARRVGESGWAVVVLAPPPGWPMGMALPIALALLGAALSGAAGLAVALGGPAAGGGARRRMAEGQRRAAELPTALQRLRPSLDELLDCTARLLAADLSPAARALAEQQRRAAQALATQLAALAPPPPRLRLLVAEDVPASRMLLQSLLQRAGHEVVAVEDGAEAVAAARGGGFDAAVLDLSMPRMDGLAAAAAIRRLDGQAGRLPLVALTADQDAGVEARCRDAGFDAVAAKPVDSRRLVRLLAALLGRGGEAGGMPGPGLVTG